MSIFGGSKKTSSSSSSSSNGGVSSSDPKYRVEYTNENGFNSETAYTAQSAEVKADIAKDSGAKNISINPFKRGR